MPENASWALQREVYQTLANASSVTSLLGGARIYDNPPQSVPYPFVTLGQSVVHDWSTGTEDGAEHLLTLHVWSQDGGKNQAFAIIDAIKSVLHDQPLSLTDNDLVNLRQDYTETRQDPDGETFHGIVRYRAVTEPAQAAAA